MALSKPSRRLRVAITLLIDGRLSDAGHVSLAPLVWWVNGCILPVRPPLSRFGVAAFGLFQVASTRVLGHLTLRDVEVQYDCRTG